MGYLDPSREDDYRIQSMAAGGTTQMPGPTAWQGVWSAVPKGVVEGLHKVGTLADGVLSPAAHPWDSPALDQRVNTLPPVDAKAPLELHVTPHAGAINLPAQAGTQTVGQLLASATPQEVGGLAGATMAATEKADAAKQVVYAWAATGQDPRKTGSIGRTLGSAAQGVTIGAVGSLAGPWGAAGLLGSTMGYNDYLQGKADGLDDKTAVERAGITGIMAGASAFIPLKFGKTAASSILGGAAVSIAAGGVQRGATSFVLAANGYPAMAKQYRVFDGEAMAADGILGGVFGAMGHFAPEGSALRKDITPDMVDAALAVAAEEHFSRSAPGVPVDPAIANLHGDTLTAALHSLVEGDLPEVSPEAAQRLVDGVLPDPIHDTARPLADAAPEFPGYDEVAADIPEQPQPAPTSPAEGEAAPEAVPGMDGFHADLLQELQHQYGDLSIPDGEGGQIRVSDMIEGMRAERARVDSDAKLHEVAAACALRSGGGV